VVSVRDAGRDHDTLAVTLGDPTYDAATRTMTFDATPLRRPARALGPRLDFVDDRLDGALPQSFGPVTLFIDDTDTEVRPDGELAATDPIPTGAEPESAAPGQSPFQVNFQVKVVGLTPPQGLRFTPLNDYYQHCVDGTPSAGVFREKVFLIRVTFSDVDCGQVHWKVEAFPDGVANGIAEVRVADVDRGYVEGNCAPIGDPSLPKVDCTWGWHNNQTPIVISITRAPAGG
jgi:hypothetical protein